MEPDPKLILLIAGIGSRKHDVYLDRLTDGIFSAIENSDSKITITHQSLGRRDIEIKTRDGSAFRYKIMEVFWGDLIPSLSDLSLGHRAVGGLLMIAYWLSGKWTREMEAESNSRIQANWFKFSMIIFFIWYVAVLLLLAQPLITALLEHFTRADWFPRRIFHFAISLVTLLIATSFLKDSLDISYSVQAFLQNTDRIRVKIRKRINSVLHGLDEWSSEHDVTLVAHSFGSVVAVDGLASKEWPPAKVRLITIGSPLRFISFREPEFVKMQEKIVVKKWIDFFDYRDWFCTGVASQGLENINSLEINLGMSWMDGALGRAHDLYFQDKRIVQEMLGIELFPA